uniref:TonB-dependent siderophore receptor n=1 Tax=Flavobacterium sp. TaxID=239 RepID=UPI00374CA717
SSASGNNQEELGSRGFTFSGNNTFKNGIRINGSLIPEASSLESIEVLKGSSALLYGNVAPGGVLNLVTKKPKFYNGGEVSFRLGEYAFYKPTVDVYGSVNNSNTLAYRVITSYEKGNSFRNGVESERFYVNPSFLIDFSEKTSLLIEGDYTKDSRTPDFGLAAIDYTVVALPRNTFLNYSWAHYKTLQNGVTSTLTHTFNDNWQAKGIFSYQGFETDLLSSLRPNSGNTNPISPTNLFNNLVQSNGDWTRGVQKITEKQDYAIAEIDVTGKFNTGTIKHAILLGSDADRTSANTINYRNISSYDKINIFNSSVVITKDPKYKDAEIPVMELRNTVVDSQIKRASLYIQDFIELTSKFKALVGLRYNYLEQTTRTLTHKTNTNEITSDTPVEVHNNLLTSKLGLIYQPTTTNTLFASYADSFVVNVGTDKFKNQLPHSTLDQYEVGSKNEFLKGHLTANVTGYYINYSNLAQTDFSDGNTLTTIKELTGSYASKGVEIDITTNYNGFKVMAGYSFNETKYTKSNIFNKGTELRFAPKNTANASLFYTFDSFKVKGLEIGVASSYVGKRLGGRLRPNNAITPAELARKPIVTDGFLQFDASLGYTFKNVSFRAKLSNLSNEINYYVYDDNTVTPIAPRMISTILSYKF